MFPLSIALALFSTPAHASPSTPDGCNLSEMGAMTFFHCLVTHNDTVEAQGSDVSDLLERVEALEALTISQAGTIVALQETVDALSTPDLSGYVTDDELASFNYATQDELAVCLVEEDLATVPVTSFPGTLATTAELDSVWAALDDLPDGGTTIVTDDGEIDLSCIETRLENLEAVNDEVEAECLYGDSDDDGQLDHIDCAPEDPTLQTYTFYLDADGDGYGSSDPWDNEGLCSTSADVSPDEGYVTNAEDCFDNLGTSTGEYITDESVNVFPGQEEWFSEDHSSWPLTFDYNCDGFEDKRWTTIADLGIGTGCTIDPEGWRSRVPDCGESEFWVTSSYLDMGYSLLECVPEGYMRVQECR